MKYLKKYEIFDFNQTIPVAAENDLTNFYSCDECNALYRKFNSQLEIKCKYCGSKNIEELSKEEWQELAKNRLDPDVIDKDIKNKDEVRINLNNNLRYD